MKIPLFTLFFFMPLLTMLSGINTGLVSGQCRKDQQSLLLQLKNTLVFHQSLSAKLVKWNSTPDCCEWPGITCDEGSGLVISLDLSFEAITGGLDDSSALFSLQFLQSLNLSFNIFDTALPVGFAHLTDLISLNLSNAGFTGQIPSSLGSLSQLESLDLSSNQLSGQIPPQLVSLRFLSVLNFSYNRLEGRIPTANQFGTFSSDSFEGNQGLCGPPLNRCSNTKGSNSTPACSNTSSSACYNTNGSNSGIEIDWNFLLGFIFGLGIVIQPLMFCKRWRTWYYKHVDRVIFRIFPKLDKRSKNLGRRAQRNRRRQ
uniref:Leucine-rich repeat-containing N-terminal plant-type domain-containing protein n=1 Tax=Populus davidiana TaxID=266767 RepID=A0A6M2ECN2_9ROSI